LEDAERLFAGGCDNDFAVRVLLDGLVLLGAEVRARDAGDARQIGFACHDKSSCAPRSSAGGVVFVMMVLGSA
jgi:hypothetical protein